ncbi:hypothetical protein ACG7TL_003821 [Trametes sanguinea]
MTRIVLTITPYYLAAAATLLTLLRSELRQQLLFNSRFAADANAGAHPVQAAYPLRYSKRWLTTYAFLNDHPEQLGTKVQSGFDNAS